MKNFKREKVKFAKMIGFEHKLFNKIISDTLNDLCITNKFDFRRSEDRIEFEIILKQFLDDLNEFYNEMIDTKVIIVDNDIIEWTNRDKLDDVLNYLYNNYFKQYARFSKIYDADSKIFITFIGKYFALIGNKKNWRKKNEKKS